MEVNGLGMEFNMPPALKSKIVNGVEVSQGLPPYKKVKAHVVDEYPDCPADWMCGSSKASSYFVEVEEGRGLWLDFNPCSSHKHDVAVVVSVQKINPITGQESESFSLEKYEKKCIIHDCDFQQDRYCPECNFKWPAQNYLATTGTPTGMFWLDGFRNEEGKVRQYILTAEKIRGVAANLIGDKRVYAIGVAFYLSKKPKPEPEYKSVLRGLNLKSVKKSYPVIYGDYPKESSLWKLSSSDNTPIGSHEGAVAANFYSCDEIPTVELQDSEMDYDSVNVPEEKLEIGAGAEIDQQMHTDPKGLDYWEEEPAGFIYINYCTKSQCKKILASGKRKDAKDGFLSGIQVGN